MNNTEIILDIQMKQISEFTRPGSLNYGALYLYRERTVSGKHQAPRIVTFVNYAPCPAIVIIKFSDGRVQRCLREDLFEPRVVTLYQYASQVLKSLFQQYFTIAKMHFTDIYQKFKIALLHPTSQS